MEASNPYDRNPFERNPYAPSQATLKQSGPPSGQLNSRATAWRYRKMLVMVPETALPDRCIKCNAPAHEPTKERKVYWHHPAVYVLILINVILYAIVGAIVRKRAMVAPGLCEVHKKSHKMTVIAAWSVFALGLALMVVAIKTDGSATQLLSGFLLMLAAVLVGMIRGRIVQAHKIETTRVWLRGCGEEFLDSLPQLPPV